MKPAFPLLADPPPTWRHTGRVLLLWGVMLLLAACVLQPETAEPNPLPAEPTAAATLRPAALPAATAIPIPTLPAMAGEVEIWHSWSNADLAFLEEAMGQLGNAYPHLRLSHTYVAPHRVTSDLLKAILSGQGPELLLAPASRLPTLQQEGLVIPLDPLIREEWLEDLVSPALFGLVHEQSLLGLPLWAETVMLYANTDLIAPADVPENSDEWLALAQGATEPVTGMYLSLFHLSWGFPAFGGVLFDVDYQVVLDQSTGGADFLAWLQQAHATPGFAVSTDYLALRESFIAGEMPLFLDGPWTLAAAEEALGHALAIHPIPAGPVGPARSWLTTEAILLVPGQSEAQQRVSVSIALALVNMDEEMIDIAHRLPVVQHRRYSGSSAFRSFRALLSSTQHMPHVPEMASVWRLGNALLAQALQDDVAPADFAVRVADFTLLANEENGK